MQYKIWILNVAVHQSEKLNAVVSVSVPLSVSPLTSKTANISLLVRTLTTAFLAFLYIKLNCTNTTMGGGICPNWGGLW